MFSHVAAEQESIDRPIAHSHRAAMSRTTQEFPGSSGWVDSVLGPETELAYHAVRSLSIGNAEGLSPLILHGPSGAGKSRLLAELATQFLVHNPEASITSISAEALLSSAISNNFNPLSGATSAHASASLTYRARRLTRASKLSRNLGRTKTSTRRSRRAAPSWPSRQNTAQSLEHLAQTFDGPLFLGPVRRGWAAFGAFDRQVFGCSLQPTWNRGANRARRHNHSLAFDIQAPRRQPRSRNTREIDHRFHFRNELRGRGDRAHRRTRGYLQKGG